MLYLTHKNKVKEAITMAETLGKVIAARREELGITQRELARGIKRSNSTISRIESPENDLVPDNETVRAIADFLKLDYNYLLALNKQIDDEPEIRMIQRAAKNMNQEQLEDMMAILKKEFKDAFDKAGADKKDV
jgi:transcriptional regulator with XRE-family HTH domain